MAIERYPDGFKKWWFWVAVIVCFIYQSYQDMVYYGSRLFLAEYLGILIASLVIITMIYSVFFVLRKLFVKGK